MRIGFSGYPTVRFSQQTNGADADQKGHLNRALPSSHITLRTDNGPKTVPVVYGDLENLAKEPVMEVAANILAEQPRGEQRYMTIFT
ncbi:MAG: hypothetical protein QE263_01790 [Vampirovibrionales bacterium]|nr:hypothetical protein [Vampirovibrionales bacterium]